MRRAIVVVAVLALVAAGLVTAWFLAWRDHPADGIAATTSPSTTTGTSTTSAPTTTTTTTEPLPDSPNRVDLIGVVIAVEREPGWDTAPTSNCPQVNRGPQPDECPLIGPGDLVLDTGERLHIPAGTPGGRWLWQMTKPVDVENITGRRAIIAAALADDGTVDWIYVLRGFAIPRDEEPGNIDLPGGEITSITADGWAVTAEGWEYRLADRVWAGRCSHLTGLTWTLAGPRPEPLTEQVLSSAELRDLWDGPQGTRLTIDRLDYATTRTVGAVTCADLLDRYRDPDPLGTLAEARALWAAAGIEYYSFRWSTGGAWGPWGGIWDIAVEYGERTAVNVAEGFGHEPPPPPTSIEDLFAMIEEDLTSPPTWGCDDPQYLTILYDPTLGYPIRLWLDHPGCMDEEHGWFVEDFTEL
jgi:hypothetical protein